MKQSAIQKKIEFIAEKNRYDVRLRKKPNDENAGAKKFRPDVIASPRKGKSQRVFEVEANVTNNTVFKSLVSLLYFTCHKAANSETYLVVPPESKKFAQGCLDSMRVIIRGHGKSMKGNSPKIRCQIITFGDVVTAAKKLKKRLAAGGSGASPKCAFLPRPK